MKLHQIVEKCIDVKRVGLIQKNKIMYLVSTAPKDLNEGIDFIIKKVHYTNIDIEKLKSFKIDKPKDIKLSSKSDFITIKPSYVRKIINTGVYCSCLYDLDEDDENTIELCFFLRNQYLIKESIEHHNCYIMNIKKQSLVKFIRNRKSKIKWKNLNIKVQNIIECEAFLEEFKDKIYWKRVSFPNLNFASNLIKSLEYYLDWKTFSKNYIPLDLIIEFQDKLYFNLLPLEKYSKEDLIYINSFLSVDIDGLTCNSRVIDKLNYILYNIESDFSRKEVNEILKFKNISKDFIIKNKSKIRWSTFCKRSDFFELIDITIIREFKDNIIWKLIKQNRNINNFFTEDNLKEFDNYLKFC